MAGAAAAAPQGHGRKTYFTSARAPHTTRGRTSHCTMAPRLPLDPQMQRTREPAASTAA